MTDLRTTLADLVHDLVDPYDHAEKILTLRHPTDPTAPKQEIRIHRTSFPSLLDQLAAAVEPSGGATDGNANIIAESRPPVRIEAVHQLQKISRGVTRWLNRLDIESRDGLNADLRLIVGAASSDDDLADIGDEVKAWVAGTRLVLGWTKPAWRPNAPCPVEKCPAPKGSLRVNLEAKTALCTSCETNWTAKDGSIQMLAEYVRWYRNDTKDKVPA